MGIKSRRPGELAAVEGLRQKLDVDIHPDLDEHGSGGTLLLPLSLHPAQMIEEVAPKLGVGPDIRHDADFIQL